MLKFTKYILTALATIPLCTSCNIKEDPAEMGGRKEEEIKKELVFTAVLPDADGSGFKTTWSEGDQILVYSIKGNFTSKETISASNITEGGKKATFKSSGKLLSQASNFYAFVKDSGVKNFKLKKYWSPANMDRCTDASPAVTVAACEASDLTFKFGNIYALMEFTIDDPSIKYVKLSGNNGELINKSMFVSFEDFSIDENTSPDFESTPYIRKYVNGAGKYYIGLCPDILFKTGYTLAGYDENNQVVVKVSTYEELSVESGKTYKAEEMSVPRVLSPVFDESNIVRSFGILSDIHIETENDAYADKFRSALNQLSAKASEKDKNGLDAVLVAGDLIQNAKGTQIAAYKSIYESVFTPTAVPMIYTVGNHDMNASYAWTSTTVADNALMASTLGEAYFKTDVDNDMRRNYEARHCVVGGTHILAVTPNSDQPINYAPSVLAWLEKQLKELTAANPEQYVLILTHPMIQNTVYGSLLGTQSEGIWASTLPNYWATSALTDILKKYPQAIVFGGHLHFPLNDPRTIWQGDFTVLGTASVRYMAIEPASYEDMHSATVMKDANEFSQGYLAQIDINGNIRFHRMDFYNKAEIGEAWTISFPGKDGSNLLPYNHTSLSVRNQKPAMSTVELVTVEGGTTSVKFAAGTDDEFVHDYTVIVKKSGAVVVAKKILADFYKHAKTADMKKEWTVELGSLENGDYELSIVAKDSWDAESDPVVKQFKVGPAEPVSGVLYADFDFGGNDIKDAKSKIAVTKNGDIVPSKIAVSHAGKSYNVDAMTATATQYISCMFPITGSPLLNWFDAGFSLEAFYQDSELGADAHSIFGSIAGGTGWCLSNTKDGKPQYNMTEFTGKAATAFKGVVASSPVSKDELTHVLFSYETGSSPAMRLYVNGKLVASKTTDLLGHIYVATGPMQWFCLGSNIKSAGVGGSYPNIKTIITDAKIYEGTFNDAGAEARYEAAVAELAASSSSGGDTPVAKHVDEWKDDAAGNVDFAETGAPEGGDGWLTFAGNKVSWTANTTGRPRTATLTFASGSTYKLTQITAVDLSGKWTQWSRLFNPNSGITSKTTGTINEDKTDITISVVANPETLAGHVNAYEVNGLYNDAKMKAAIELDYAKKTAKIGLFFDRRTTQLAKEGVYCAFIPELETANWTGYEFAPKTFGPENCNYDWLWLKMEDNDTFRFLPHVQEVMSGSAKKKLIGISIVTGTTSDPAALGTSYNTIYQANYGKIDAEGLSFKR